MTDYKECARQMRENVVKNEQGNIVCSAELWEEIASIIERSIVPPCNVNDVIYTFVKDAIAAHRVERIEIHSDNSISLCFSWHGMGYEHKFAKDIGKTVFLTKEEAEQALAKMK